MGAILRAINKKRDELRAPNTRSWMSLPATMQAGRIYLRKGIDKVKIVSYSRGGKRLTSREVKISPDAHVFVYVRTINKAMYTHAATPQWLNTI